MRASTLAHLALATAASLVALGCSKSGNSDNPDAAPTGPDASLNPQCSDGVDNDNDGKTDFPNDPGCLNANQNSETDDCPTGPNCPQCGNGADDDHDGKTDYPMDPDCQSASDTNEQGVNFDACGPDVPVNPLPANNVATGTINLGASHMISNCGGLGPETAYQIDVIDPIVFSATTDSSNTGVDTVLSIRGAMCTDGATELACNDNASTATKGSTVTVPLGKGTYYLIVDAAGSSDTGTYELHTMTYPGQGTPCDAQHTCATGFFCRTAPGDTATSCQPPRCGDGYDNDSPADGKTDYPADPGCASPTDDDEADDCPDGPNCPACANGKDDDKDGKTDYPADPDCTSAAQVTESCGTEQDPIGMMSSGSVTGDTSSFHADWTLSCGSTDTAPDAVSFVQLPHLDSLTITTAGSSFDTVLGLGDQTCGTQLACNDESPNTTDGTSELDLTGVAAGSYAVIVDGYSGSSGAFTLNVSGVISAGARCDVPLAAAGVLTCASGTTCDGSICKGTNQCDNGADDDNDGKYDYPNDPGCTAPTDDTETDDCPTGPNCPVCSNGQDDDKDGLTDYPADTSCVSAAGTSESCASSEAPIVLAAAATAGDTTGKADDFQTSCATDTGEPDLVYQLDLPAVTSLHADVVSSWGAAVELLDGSCTGTGLACDYGTWDHGALAAGRYYLVVDGYYTGDSGTFTLNVAGTIAAGGRCDGALATGGALACDAGYACKGTTTKTCQPAACNDGADNDNDQKKDFPNDPGCTSPSDDSETDDCPNGPNCPVCSNGKDDDKDGQTDYPADTACTSAAGTSESCASVDPVLPLTAASTMGSTTTAHADFTLSCGDGTAAPDQVYQADLPAMTTVTFDMSVNNFDEILGVLGPACGAGAELDCNDTPGTITLTNLAAGRYFVVASGWASTEVGTYLLAVSGKIASGGACEGALATAGAITCDTGLTCKGNAGSKTCKP